jgi:hypothetical protein
MKRALSYLLAALAGLIATGSSLRAGPIEWKYNWTPVFGSTILSDNTLSKVTLSNEPLDDAAGTSDIVATNITTFSNAPRANPDTFSNGAYKLQLQLTDVASGLAETFFFEGKLTGDLSKFSSNLLNTFTSPQTIVKVIGDNEYTVTIGYYVPPGPPTSDNKGSIGARVVVRPLDVNKTPEPSTMILSFVGLSLMGVAGWRSRRQTVSVELA